MQGLTGTIQSLKISVIGVVQGVGFRPFVYRIAKENALNGWVRNTSGSVEIVVEGKEEDLNTFLHSLKTEAPPICHIEDIKTRRQAAAGYTGFSIKTSRSYEGRYQLISPDIATCPQCLAEIMGPADRRYRYPFTNCTNCGPRFTIIKDIPYDRPRTTMAEFKMCPQCRREYDDPSDRRFHAQPNACAVCGPQLEMVDKQGKMVAAGNEALKTAVEKLFKGSILAIKGLGGFLFACDATSDEAVALLRKRKHRAAKPLAVMFEDIEQARRHCRITPEEEDLLLSSPSPIVLVRWLENPNMSSLVAPGLKYQGIMLPYTPLHHLLLKDVAIPLVMTSGNISEEPIVCDNDEALQTLEGIADYFLMHNRDIYARYDDSVVMAGDETQIIRRARGYAPSPIHLPFKSKQILACGGELKNTFCLVQGDYVFVSQHIADMENLESLEHYKNTIELYKKLFSVKPQIIAHDLHPDYMTTDYARELAEADSQLSICAVQHHHAHIVSCMVENGVTQPVIGVAFDGTGYGIDGQIWGGEFLLADYRGFQRLGQLQYMPLPGGDAAIKKPYRIAISYIYSLLGKAALKRQAFISAIDDVEIETIIKQLDRQLNAPLTSSCGRLFDAVSALIGIMGEIKYEAQAAIELEMVATDAGSDDNRSYPFSVVKDKGRYIIGFGNTLAAIISDLEKGVNQPVIAARFHRTIAQMTADVCRCIADETSVSRIALSGGVFQNRLLLKLTLDALNRARLDVITHRQLPTNDGCISLGQAVIANFMTEEQNVSSCTGTS
ncbi:MAG: carbamoyltransferase HypF [Chloroflexota bacterium]